MEDSNRKKNAGSKWVYHPVVKFWNIKESILSAIQPRDEEKEVTNLEVIVKTVNLTWMKICLLRSTI